MKKMLVAVCVIVTMITNCAFAEGLLPNLAGTIGVPMPSVAEALNRIPEQEVKNEDGSLTEYYSNVTESDFNTFSLYLETKEATLADYNAANGVLSATIQAKGQSFFIVYRPQEQSLESTYPKGTYDEKMKMAAADYQTAKEALEKGNYDEAAKIFVSLRGYQDVDSILDSDENLAAAAKGDVMSHADYLAAENDTEVVIESYVQDHQSWWDGKVTVYLQSEDGAYFAYELKATEEETAKLTQGQKVRIKGFKGEWAGEVEIMDGTVEFLEGDPYVAAATDVTELLGKDELAQHMNEFVAVKGATIVDYDGNGAAFAYKNAEEKSDDLYFKVDVGGQVYEFCVEFYLRGKDTDVYKAVEGLKVGDVVDLEGFLYWYNGANLQATSLTVK